MTNEQAQKIASLSEEMMEAAICCHETEGLARRIDASPTATYRQRLEAHQRATADRALLLRIELDILDAISRANNGE